MERSRNGTKKSRKGGEKETEMENSRMEQGTGEKEEGTRAKKARNQTHRPSPSCFSNRFSKSSQFSNILAFCIQHTPLPPSGSYLSCLLFPIPIKEPPDQKRLGRISRIKF